MYKFSGTGLSDRGRNRQNNEDYFVIEQSLGLFILCDGVGGHNSGEVASAVCAKTVLDVMQREREKIEKYHENPSPELRKQLTQLIYAALQEANEAVTALSVQGLPTEGLATTAEVLLILPNYALLGHVGDSRTYISRAGTVYQLSMDHKFAVEMVKNGTWDQAMAAQSPFANTLTRAVGAQEVVQPDILEIEITADDLFVMCTDGFSDYFDTQEIQRLISGAGPKATPAELPKVLIDAANQKGGKDNITALVAKITERQANSVKPIDVVLKQESLGKVPLFCYLSFAEITKILAIASVKSLKKGEILFKENDPATEMFVIVSGTAQVRKGSELLTELQHGASIGEMAILDQSLRSATITAREDAVLLVIPRAALMRLLQQDHGIAVKFLWAMSQELDRRLRSTSQSLMEARKILAEKRERDDLPFVCDDIPIKNF